jgi:hypothetical protein
VNGVNDDVCWVLVEKSDGSGYGRPIMVFNQYPNAALVNSIISTLSYAATVEILEVGIWEKQRFS